MPTDTCTEEYLLPQVEALLAGTLALMTGLSHTEGPCARRELMRDKVRANLQELAAHPHVSATLRVVLARLVEHWRTTPGAATADHAGAPPRVAWLH